MPTKSTTRHLRLILSILRTLPLANVTIVNMFGLHGDERDPAEFEPGSCFGLDDLCVLTARADSGGAVSFLFDFGWATKD